MLSFSEDHRTQKSLLREQLVLGALEREQLVQLDQLAYEWHCHAAQLTEWDEEEKKFEYHRKEADKLYKNIGRSLFPWYKNWSEEEGKALADLWKRFKAEEQKPEFQKWRQTEKARLRSFAEQARAEHLAFTAAMTARQQAEQSRKADQLKRAQRVSRFSSRA